MIRLLVGLVLFFVVLRLGLAVLRLLARPLPEPPPPGELRKVNLRYRCGTCGVQLKMTAAPDEDPVAPRHCMEDMDLVASPLE